MKSPMPKTINLLEILLTLQAQKRGSLHSSMRLTLTWFIFSVVLLSSCSKFRRIQRSDDWKLKYDAAIRYFESKDYYRSSILMEELIPVIRGRKEAEKLMFYYCYTFFYQNQFILSAHRFDDFARLYSRGQYAQEAKFMHAYSLYMQSPEYQLDQSSTVEAMSVMQRFIEEYPSTEYADRGAKLIDELQRKLEKKAYEIAKQYFKIRSYRPALVAFDNFNSDFPDSRYNEEIDYLKIRTQYIISSESISSKQKERFLETIEFYEEYLDKYPQGENLKKAESLFIASRNKLERIK